MTRVRLGWLLVIGCLIASVGHAADSLPEQAASAFQRAIKFYHGTVASHGGYVYRYSEDLAKREGEGQVGPDTVWVQPPGTPAVGMAFLEAYERTGDATALRAARDAAECLIRGQLRSGGWNQSIEFAPAERKKFAYRVDAARERQFNVTTFDDDKSQSAMRLLMRLDHVLKFQDEPLHEASLLALDSVVKAQFPNGAWAQGFDEFPNPADFPVKLASFPESWPRTFPGGKYWRFYTLNDNAMADTIDAMLLAGRLYQQPKYRDAALRAGEFLIQSQLPEPQPAWAQQYDFDMHPVWARKFEPPAITGSESQGVIRILMRLFVETGDRKFLAPIPKALDYLERSKLPNGQIARFYELQTNKPLYFTKQYELTYDDGDLPTHYGFKVDNKVESLRREYNGIVDLAGEKLEKRRAEKNGPRKSSPPSDAVVQNLIRSLDARGAWVEDGKLKYHAKSDDTRRVIDSSTFIKNIGLLSQYLASAKPQESAAVAEPAPSKWEKDIAAFEAADRKESPPKNGIVFVGSSSIRLWDVKNAFPDLPVINRGFGGSQIEDSVKFAERIVFPYQPRVVVFYAGDNDINAGKSAERVASDFRAFAAKVHDKVPKTTLIFVAIKPSPSRAKHAATQQAANRMIREFCEADPRRQFLDIVPKMLNADGQARPELFLKDMLHMNADGYRLWNDLLRPHLDGLASKE